ncbi:MAG: WD40/YVTN/BNR-like repeat-containing protein, partial [Ktedonobacterales bacterium]
MRILLAMGSFWRSAFSARWLRRGVVVLVVGLVCTACDTSSTPSMSRVTTVSGRAPRPLAASAWEQIALPAPATDVQGLAVSPTDPATIFVCTAHLPTIDDAGGVAAQPMMLWRTTDSGAHWTRHTSMLSSGFGCDFAFAPDDAQRVGFQVGQMAQDAQPCAHDSFYLTTDGGARWQRLPPHASIAPINVSGGCGLHVTRSHLYLTYSFTFAPQVAQVSLLERSDDNGRTWTRADRGL